ncbi:MAG TPA: tRNA (N6-threonylcarbamoyladenosine(37)-N6)-methyltransferase TrmO [Polyangiaceae bacterium]
MERGVHGPLGPGGAAPLSLTPIGVIRTPFVDRASAPRQPAAARGVKGTLELHPDGRFEHALQDLNSFSHIWVLFWFHLNDSWHSKVLPPRSDKRRGVFATRSPYRPNPLGMSVLRLERVEGLTLHVLDVDIIDGTPLLDIKPYLPYTDAVTDADHGWLTASLEAGVVEGARPFESQASPGSGSVDPRAAFAVRFSPEASAQLAFLRERHSLDLSPRIAEVLTLGPSPHPYRRIKKDGTGFVLAVREWRARFRVDGETVTVDRVLSGYRPSVLFSTVDDPALGVHREYVAEFGADGTLTRTAKSR